jgi:hypothetical protein
MSRHLLFLLVKYDASSYLKLMHLSKKKTTMIKSRTPAKVPARKSRKKIVVHEDEHENQQDSTTSSVVPAKRNALTTEDEKENKRPSRKAKTAAAGRITAQYELTSHFQEK